MAHSPDPLEKFVHETLRSAPSRRAPSSLEQRVLAKLARRAALPWYRQSFLHWPTAARVAFLTGSAGLAAAAVALGMALYRKGFGGGFAEWSIQMKHQLATLQTVGSTFASYLPEHALWWAIGAGVAFLAMSVCTVGLGAAAYRLLWKNS